MKVLIVMSGFFPGQKYGGPPVSVKNFCALMDEYECFIITTNHDLGSVNPYDSVPTGVWTNYNNINILYLAEKDYNRASFEKEIKKIKPDFLYLQGLFQKCIVPCLFLANKYKIKVLLAPRGELCSGAFKKKYKKIPYIIFLRLFGLLKNVHFQSTSTDETKSIKKILGCSLDLVHELPNIPSGCQRMLNKKCKTQGELSLIFLSRIVPKKNLLFALKILKDVDARVCFDIYGPIEDDDYWKDCALMIKSMPPNINVNYCGALSHENVSKMIGQYHALFFPTLSENYGHVIAESLMAGVPVIISDQTPWNDVEKYHAGWALPLANANAFVTVVSTMALLDENDYEEKRQCVIQYIEEKIDLKFIKMKYKSFFN